MRKFDIPNRKSKKAMPKAEYRGETVSVRGVARIDEASRCYYRVKPVADRNSKTMAVRCDKLIAL